MTAFRVTNGCLLTEDSNSLFVPRGEEQGTGQKAMVKGELGWLFERVV